MPTPTRSTPTQVSPTKKVAIIQPVITKYFNRITRKEAEILNQVAQINKFNEIMRRNKELEREVRALQDRLNTLTTENKELRNNLNTRRNSNKTDNEIKQDNSKKQVDDEKYRMAANSKPSAPKPPQQILSQNDAENQTEVKVKKPKTRPISNKDGGPTVLQEEEPKSKRKQVVVIAGDSIVKGQKGWLMSRTKNVRCHAFSGATCSDMEHCINPISAKKPNHVILHCGTNDLMDSNPEDIAEKIKDLATKVTKNKINCTVSSLIMLMDRDLNEKIFAN